MEMFGFRCLCFEVGKIFFNHLAADVLAGLDVWLPFFKIP